MNYAFTATQAWAVVLGLGIPLFVLWWWARRHAPISGEQRDYSVGYRTAEPEPAAHTAGIAAGSHAPVAMPDGMVDAPIMANPAHLEPPTAVAAPPASIAAEPLPAGALPPESAGAESHLAPPLPVAVVSAAETPIAVVTPPVAAPKPANPAAPAAETLPPAAEVVPPATSPVDTTPAPTIVPAPVAAQPAPASHAAPAADTVPTPPAHVSAAAPAATEPPAPAPAPAAAPSAPPAAPGAGDDLSRILNVTPQIVEILHGAGIHSYRELAAADAAHLRQLLDTAGLQAVDPSTWPQQGRFAAGGKWKQLQNLQNRLAAG